MAGFIIAELPKNSLAKGTSEFSIKNKSKKKELTVNSKGSVNYSESIERLRGLRSRWRRMRWRWWQDGWLIADWSIHSLLVLNRLIMKLDSKCLNSLGGGDGGG